MKVITVWILRDTRTDRYDAGRLIGGKPACTVESPEAAMEYDEEDLEATYPNGIPAGWEKIKVSEFEAKKGRG